VAARAHAENALRLARDAAVLPTLGRTLLFLGEMDGDLLRLEEADAVFRSLDDHGGVAAARIGVAELLLEGGRAEQALSHLQEAARRQGRLPDGQDAAGPLAARRHHLTAGALRRLGRGHEATSVERQAWLALSLLPDDEALSLRLAVAAGRAGDAIAAGRFDEAVEWHARAAELARRMHDPVAELAAVRALADDLVALGRVDDALHHHVRALELADALDDREAGAAVARQALGLLDAVAPDDARRERFEAVLASPTGSADRGEHGGPGPATAGGAARGALGRDTAHRVRCRARTHGRHHA
jgi:tetratricopeptide (TPR) repeat protein